MARVATSDVNGRPRRPQHWRSPRPGPVPLLVMLLACSAVGAAARAAASAHEQAAQGAGYDASATETARVLAGLAPDAAARFVSVTSRPAWRAYRDDVDRNWSRLQTGRFAAMRAWSDREVKPEAGPCDTLFYPFGGPDFVNAYVLFPGCSRYLLFGLEPVGSMPALERGDPQAVDALLRELRASLTDVFVRDYFITREMMTELKTPGVNGTLPLLLVFLARLDARIVDVRMESPWPEGDPSVNPAPAQGLVAGAARLLPQRPTAVTIRFTAAGSSRVQTLSYARVRMEDAEFSRQEALLAYLNRHAPFTTMLKSASYLLHDNQFSRVRSAVLTGSRAVLQDDTGVPFRFFDKSDWSVRLFGRYSPPVKDFNYGGQPDLEDAYRDTAAVHDLPFAFGYHWRQGTSSVMLAIRTGRAR
jgi:hypothetical protein